jgi:hypothetical protein
VTTGVVIAIAVGLAVLVLLGSLIIRRRDSDDDVETFRRQIDALSPESRRPTIDRLKPTDDPSMKPPVEPSTGDDEGDVT